MAPLKTIKFGMTSSRVHSCDVLINHLTTEPELFEFSLFRLLFDLSSFSTLSTPSFELRALPAMLRKPPAHKRESFLRAFAREVLRHVE